MDIHRTIMKFQVNVAFLTNLSVNNFICHIFFFKMINQIACRFCTTIAKSFNKSNGLKTVLNNGTFQQNWVKNYSNSSGRLKVTILGAGGKIGKTVSLMLKQSSLIDELCLYDTMSLAPFISDLNCVDTKCVATSYYDSKDLKKALNNSNVVVVLTSAPFSDSLNYNSLFERNASLLKDLAANVAKYAPKALVAIGTEPINSIVPMFSEIMRKSGHYNPNMVFGIITIDVVRANKFVAEILDLEPECVIVPIIGGHTEKTMVPVLSQATPCAEFSLDELQDITQSLRLANDNLLRVKASDGAYLSSAFATSRFILALVKGITGQPNIVECAYVRSKVHPQLKYLITPLLLGSGGIVKNLEIPELTDYEQCLFENAIPNLVEDIKKGEITGGRVERPACDVCDPNPKAPRCPPDHCKQRAFVK